MMRNVFYNSHIYIIFDNFHIHHVYNPHQLMHNVFYNLLKRRVYSAFFIAHTYIMYTIYISPYILYFILYILYFITCTYRVAKTHRCLKPQVIFRKRVTNYRALLCKMTYKDQASHDFTPPCMCFL